MNQSQQATLFPIDGVQPGSRKKGKTTEQLKRLDADVKLLERLRAYCRLRHGDIWEDPISGHRVGVLDAANRADVNRIMGGEKTGLIINDPPYNMRVGNANTTTLSKVNTL